MEWTAYISRTHFILISCVVLLFPLFINLLIVRKVNGINMTEALKSVDYGTVICMSFFCFFVFEIINFAIDPK